MLCNFCNIARLDNEAPCPNCGAPSPLAGRMQSAFGSSGVTGIHSQNMQNAQNVPMPGFGMGVGPTVTGQLGNPFAPQQSPAQLANAPVNTVNTQGMAFLPQTPQVAEPVPQQPFSSQPPQPQPPLQSAQPPQSAPMSLLPVPYQGGAAGQQGGALLPAQNMDMMDVGDAGTMLSAIPLSEEAVYVAPMYTKPRPIIPRYRAISGLLSVLIVALLACGAAGYYAKTSSQFAFLRQLYGSSLPANQSAPAAGILPVPKQGPQFGLAANIITSATTNTRVDPQTHISEQPSKTFKTGQTIFLTYSIQPPKKASGSFTIKWYTNNTLYQTSKPMNVTYAISGYTTQSFAQPFEGMVELYWNNQLGVRLYFVVQ